MHKAAAGRMPQRKAIYQLVIFELLENGHNLRQLSAQYPTAAIIKNPTILPAPPRNSMTAFPRF
jgi:hypothetical protein